MTLRALCPSVQVMTRVYPEPPRIMIHRVWPPHTRAVARCTVMTEQLRHMIWIRDPLEIRLMTLVTVRVMQLVVTIHVARLARCCNVSTRQREERRVMIECRRAPSRC